MMSKTWTLAYRNPRANRFVRADDFAGTWAQAWELSGRWAAEHPGMEVWYVPTAEHEAENPGHEDNGNVLAISGRRVRIVEGGTVGGLEPLSAAEAQATWENPEGAVIM